MSSISTKTMLLSIRCLLILMLFSIVASAGKNNENPAIYSVKPLIKPRVALTFDDGPHAILTPRLMDILKPLNANVTFFVMGIKVEKHATILQRAVREGHEIANHVWNHPILSKIPRETVFDQLWKTNMAIQRAIGFAPKIMRPPYGNTNKPLNQYIAERGNLSVIMWSFDTQDWKHPGPKAIVDRALQKIKEGDIILMHDIHPDSIAAIPGLVAGIQNRGIELVTVSELINSKQPQAT